jgi:hypothetical protein
LLLDELWKDDLFSGTRRTLPSSVTRFTVENPGDNLPAPSVSFWQRVLPVGKIYS